MAKPTISTDCNNKCTTVTLGPLTVTFSYTTPVAFRYFTQECYLSVVSENVWSQTTGRHLSSVDGGSKQAKAERFPHDLFTALLDLVCAGDKRSLAKAVRLYSTHVALQDAGVKVSA